MSENHKVGEVSVTYGVRQYAPKAGEDAHFVYQSEAKPDWQRFLGALLAGETPVIGE
jgi:hypothetical protein